MSVPEQEVSRCTGQIEYGYPLSHYPLGWVGSPTGGGLPSCFPAMILRAFLPSAWMTPTLLGSAKFLTKYANSPATAAFTNVFTSTSKMLLPSVSHPIRHSTTGYIAAAAIATHTPCLRSLPCKLHCLLLMILELIIMHI